MNSDARPGGVAEDLSAGRFAELTAEVDRLRAELRKTWRVVDDLLDRESLHVNAPHMECLTTSAEMDRRSAPRVRHLPAVEETAAGASTMAQVWA